MKERMSVSKLILFLIFYAVLAISIQLSWYPQKELTETSTPALGNIIFNLQGFVVPFEILSLLLLAAMIGAVYLAKEEWK
jgi:NADH:ubiquinone oxidoreductase subunit 6 (subunit J)